MPRLSPTLRMSAPQLGHVVVALVAVEAHPGSTIAAVFLPKMSKPLRQSR